ncbi:hypothetical protein BT69DRAFT_1288029 [Atractiella rhizophila]|nr:hypothetical protein BT69DRAFT_1288029 [Atractiella rhizophila]
MTTSTTDIAAVKSQLRTVLNPALLVQIHNERFPFPKGAALSWTSVCQNFWDALHPTQDATLYALRKPIWLALASYPLDILLQIDFRDFLDPKRETYLEEVVALIYILDQTRGQFKGVNVRYTNSFFDILAEKTAAKLFDDVSPTGKEGVPAPDSPFNKEAWLKRGWTFEEYVVRMDWIWAPLIHSEKYMSEYRSLNKSLLVRYRKEEEKDLYLWKIINSSDPPSKENQGRELGMADYAWPMLRMMTAHFSIIDTFGRYPYDSDLRGRDLTDEEKVWMEKAGYGRMPDEMRQRIRKDVDAGVWSPLEVNNPKYEQPEENK